MAIQNVSGIILAAGRSRRLGYPKHLLPWDGRTMLEHVVDQIRHLPLQAVVVVLGPSTAPLALRLEALGAIPVRVPEGAQACAISIRTGLRAVGETDAAMIFLGDQPALPLRAAQVLLSGWQERGRPLQVIRYREGRGHPVLVARSLFETLEARSGEKVLWELIAQHPGWVAEVPVDLPLPRDIDTWTDYLSLRAEAGLPPVDLPAGPHGVKG